MRRAASLEPASRRFDGDVQPGESPMAEALWAPWRMEYILGERGDSGAVCVFCALAATPTAEHRANLVLVVQEHAFACLNRYPFAAGHLLVIPRRHVGDLADLVPEEYDATMRLLRDTVARVKTVTAARGVNVGMNLGQAAGAGIADHLHAHVVPRWPGDTNFLPVLADVRVMPEYLDVTWARLAPAFADLSGIHR
jgi:ATP adenylyltransferase